MKSAVLEFRRDGSDKRYEGLSIDTLHTIAELRSHLESVAKAITAVEKIVLAETGKNPSRVRTTASRRKKAGPAAERKDCVITIRPRRPI